MKFPHSLRADVCRLVLALAGVASVSSCTREMTVGSAFPAPVMEKIPARVGLIVDPALQAHTHSEDLAGGGSWRVELGEANATLFRQLMAGMFDAVVPVERPRSRGDISAVFQPAIEEYQFSTPEQSKTEYYEAWIQYRLRVYSPDGELVADWPFTGYGRSRGRLLDAAGSLDEATQGAMRDAAAVVVLELAKQPAVHALLFRQSSEDVATGGEK